MDYPDYKIIYKHYENRLQEHGPSHLGMDWPNRPDLDKRFKVMLNLLRAEKGQKISLLDLGCGIGLLLDYMKENKIFENIEYKGIDISSKMITKAKEFHPSVFFETRDLLLDPLPEEYSDYVIMNGVLTEKLTLSQEEMELFSQSLIKSAYQSCKKGIAFNVMSTHVDWIRSDLFHWPIDKLVGFLIKNCSRHIVINMDYGLYEYTAYVYKKASYEY